MSPPHIGPFMAPSALSIKPKCHLDALTSPAHLGTAEFSASPLACLHPHTAVSVPLAASVSLSAQCSLLRTLSLSSFTWGESAQVSAEWGVLVPGWTPLLNGPHLHPLTHTPIHTQSPVTVGYSSSMQRKVL